MTNAKKDTRDPTTCRACGLRRPTKAELREHRWSGPDDICWAREPRCREELCRDAIDAAVRLRRFVDAYFTNDNITEEAGNVLGETGWLDR